MEHTTDILASHRVRKCISCGKATMLDVSTDEGEQFRCTNCDKTIDLWRPTERLAGLAVAGGMLSLLLADDHLFWALWQVVTHPFKELPAMLVDGPFGPLLIPLGLILINILLVGLPIMALFYLGHDLYARVQNPLVDGAQADGALQGHEFKPTAKKAKLTRQDFLRAILIAGAIHIGFVALSWAVLTFADRETFEAVVEKILPGLLLTGGVLFGARRWMVAIIWLLLLPVSGFIVAVLTGQLSSL